MFRKLIYILFFIISPVFADEGSKNDESIIDINYDIHKYKILLPKAEMQSDEKDNPILEEVFESIFLNIERNLDSTGSFSIIKTNDIVDIKSTENTGKYKNDGIDAIFRSEVFFKNDGKKDRKIEMNLTLFDINDSKIIFAKYYIFTQKQWRNLSNIISNDIFTNITGEKPGHFNTKIVYIAESGRILNRIKKIASINFDGSDQKYITDGKSLVLTPVISKDGKKIYYLDYSEDIPQIYMIDENGKRRRNVGSFQQMTFSPSINPSDSSNILLSLSEDGASNIINVDLHNKIAVKLTNNSYINTSPSFSSDGEKIVFCSDMNYRQKLYIMDKDGGNLKELKLSNRGNYSKPAWSPNGKYIAFTKQLGKNFYIGISDLENGGEKILTKGYMVEGVKWSPNSRYLLYSKQLTAYGKTSIPKLFIIDILTGFEYKLKTPEGEGASDPDWVSLN